MFSIVTGTALLSMILIDLLIFIFDIRHGGQV